MFAKSNFKLMRLLPIFKRRHVLQCFDMTKLYSNSIHSIADIYGIEAARSVIVQEVINVFGVYGEWCVASSAIDTVVNL